MNSLGDITGRSLYDPFGRVVTLLRSLGLSRDKWLHRFEVTRPAEPAAASAEPPPA